MYSQNKKSNAFIGFLIALLMVIPAVLGVIFADNIKGWFGTPDDVPTEEVPDVDGDVMTEIQDSDMLKLTKRNKVSASGQSLSVSATLAPDWVVDKTVSWSLAWNGSNSDIVSQYVSITPSSDTLTCEVKVLKEFTTQIILTCKANSKANVKATCTIDYVGRTLNMVNGPSQQEWDDLIGEKYSNYTLEQLVNYEWDFLDISSYSVNGGTLQGTLKNIKYSSIKIEGSEVSNSLSQTLEDFLNSKYGDIGNAMVEIDRTLDVEVFVVGDVYYNDTLIKSGVTYSTYGHYLVSEGGYSATGLTLSDTQLIF